MGEFKYDITEVSLGLHTTEVSLKKSTCGRPFILSTSTSINYELPHHRIIVLLCRSYSKYHVHKGVRAAMSIVQYLLDACPYSTVIVHHVFVFMS